MSGDKIVKRKLLIVLCAMAVLLAGCGQNSPGNTGDDHVTESADCAYTSQKEAGGEPTTTQKDDGDEVTTSQEDGFEPTTSREHGKADDSGNPTSNGAGPEGEQEDPQLPGLPESTRPTEGSGTNRQESDTPEQDSSGTPSTTGTETETVPPTTTKADPPPATETDPPATSDGSDDQSAPTYGGGEIELPDHDWD